MVTQNDSSARKTDEECTGMPMVKRYCFKCKKVQRFRYCDNCGHMFCLGHAFEETDGDWQSGYTTYLTHDCK